MVGKIVAALAGSLPVVSAVTVTSASNYCVSDHPDQTSNPAVSFPLDTAMKLIYGFCGIDVGNRPVANWDQTIEDYGYIWHPRIQNCRVGGALDSDRVDWQDCETFLQSAVNNCNTDTTSNKFGNVLTITGDDGYCMMYGLWAETDPNPPTSAVASDQPALTSVNTVFSGTPAPQQVPEN